MSAVRSNLAVFGRLLRMARAMWPGLATIFVLDQFSWVLMLLTPLPLKIVLDTLDGKTPLPLWLARRMPADWSASSYILFAVLLQLAIVTAILLRDSGSYTLCTYIGERLTLDFRSRVFRHAQRLSLAFHDSRGTSDSIYRIQYDTQSIQWIIIYGVGPLCSSTISLIAALTATALLNWKLALVALAVTPLLVVIPKLFKGIGAERYRLVKEQESDALKVIQEVLTSIRVVKAFGREDDEEQRFVHRSRSTIAARLRLALAESGLGMAIKITTALGAALVLYLGARDILLGVPTVWERVTSDAGVTSLIHRVMTIGELSMVIWYTAQLYAPLENITRKIADIQWSLVSVGRAFELLDHEPDVPDRPDARPLAQAQGRIALENVSFAYPSERHQPILDQVNLTVAPGTRLGLVGRTGAGKSTLISLLLRFYDPTQGQVTLDGVDVRDYKVDDLRNQFAIVLQEPVLFSTTIADNIAYSRPGATPAMIEAAARAAEADAFIRSFPQGYATQVGERGLSLSGGERQRISLARAFLKDAPILIMDEPTSAVDVQTEARIMAALERLMHGRTCFLITHRPSTLRYCDRIVAVENGRLVEKSLHEAMSVVEDHPS